MNPVIERLYATREFVGEDGSRQEVHSGVDREEGQFLFNLIAKDASVSKTLEVGCAFGLSSLHICEATAGRPDAFHVIIDPFQHSNWHGAGVKHLNEAGFAHYRLIEQKSELALPRLLEAGRHTFDFAFIDGKHTLDQVMVDCFFATELLRVGGYLVLDDINMPAIHRVADYLKSYPCYEVVATVIEPRKRRSLKNRILKSLLSVWPEPRWKKLVHWHAVDRIFNTGEIRMIALRKTAVDERRWDWYPDGF